MIKRLIHLFFFFFNDTATTEIYTLSLHDALPIFGGVRRDFQAGGRADHELAVLADEQGDRKSTRLNSSHGYISYAVFCLKKKTTTHGSTSHAEKSVPEPKRATSPPNVRSKSAD